MEASYPISKGGRAQNLPHGVRRGTESMPGASDNSCLVVVDIAVVTLTVIISAPIGTRCSPFFLLSDLVVSSCPWPPPGWAGLHCRPSRSRLPPALSSALQSLGCFAHQQFPAASGSEGSPTWENFLKAPWVCCRQMWQSGCRALRFQGAEGGAGSALEVQLRDGVWEKLSREFSPGECPSPHVVLVCHQQGW